MSDGITITPDIMNWKYFSYPVTFQTLAFLALTAGMSKDGVVVVSVRDMARKLHGITYKEIRTAMDHLQEESVIRVEKQGRNTIVRFQQWHALSSCILPFRAQSRAQLGAQSQSSEMPENTDVFVDSDDSKGAIKGAIKGAVKKGAQLGAQLGAQSQSSEMPENTDVLEDSEESKGAVEGAVEGALVGKRNEKEKSTPPTPPTKKETSKEKGRKKIKTDAAFFENLKNRFNALFRGTKIPECTRMTDDRKLLVKHFIDDYSTDDIEVLLQKVLASTDLMNPKRKGNTPFNWIFTPKNYTDIMEGSYDDFQPGQKEQKGEPQQVHQPTQGKQLMLPWAETEEYQAEKEEKWQKEHGRLQGIADAAMRNGKGSVFNAAMAAYRNGKFKEYGIIFTPPDEEPATASAADIIEADPEGYLAKILKQ